MKKNALALVLALALTLVPARAHAGFWDDLGRVFLVVTLVVGVGAITVETLTGVATYKNLNSRANHQDASPFWVGMGGVGGLGNVLVGSAIFAGGLPETHRVACPDPKSGVYLEEYTPVPGNPDICDHRVPAKTGSLVAGTIFFSFGALALGSAIAAPLGSSSGDSSSGGPGKTPAIHGLSIPVLAW